jgi:hypothetical protein
MNEQINGSYVLIKRTSQYANSLRQIGIFIDDKKVGTVKNGERKKFPVVPGKHQISAKIDWGKTPSVPVTVPIGQTEMLVCGSEISGWKVLLAVFYLFMPTKWIYLRKEAEFASVS